MHIQAKFLHKIYFLKLVIKKEQSFTMKRQPFQKCKFGFTFRNQFNSQHYGNREKKYDHLNIKRTFDKVELIHEKKNHFHIQ